MTPARRDALVLAAILALATVLRVVGLPGRGEWDEDQGSEMLALLHWVRDGDIPLVGPLSSIPGVHHGAAFYWLLGPTAMLTDADPVAITVALVVLGVGAVAATWWLGHTVSGATAAHVAALLMGVSPSAIQASTFVWNANVVGPGAAVATAAAWFAWRTRRARWWSVAAAGALLMLNGHLLAVLLLVPLAGLLAADIWRREHQERRGMLGPAVGAVVILTVGYLPTLIHEARNGFPETSAVAAYVAGGEGVLSVPGHLPIIAWRVLAWPASGFADSAPALSLAAAVITATALVVAARGEPGITRTFGRWAAASTVSAIIALAVLSPSLAVFVVELPNDQYHAWVDPILFAAVGVATSRLLTAPRSAARTVLAAAIPIACVAFSLIATPPLSSPDGGWPVAQQAAARIRSLTGDRPTAVTGIAKNGTALEFPLRREGASITDPGSADFLVIVCDPRFELGVALRCGGAAEYLRRSLAGFSGARLMDRFSDSPRRTVSVYERR